jgi:hypothetical protein
MLRKAGNIGAGSSIAGAGRVRSGRVLAWHWRHPPQCCGYRADRPREPWHWRRPLPMGNRASGADIDAARWVGARLSPPDHSLARAFRQPLHRSRGLWLRSRPPIQRASCNKPNRFP